MSLADKYLSFSGRLRRRDWWLLGILLMVVTTVLSQLAVYALYGVNYTMFSNELDQIAKATHLPSVGVQVLVGLLTLWPALALSAKRAHDRDKGATTVIVLIVLNTLLSYGSAIYNAYVGIDPQNPSLWMVAPGLISFVIMIFLLITLGFLDGTPDDNRFGPSPKAEPVDETFA